ncbi:MAG: ferrous iron transport protein B, partial [Erysipelotrichaceae bacterium]|nr:ferrous iron transport protein B [Erysipelotrichaceae bacterium]
MKLDNLAIGKSAVIVSVGGTGALRQHFLDMGLIQGVEVTMVKYAPMGDPIEIKIHDFELTLRKEDAQKIEIKEVIKKEELKNENIIFKNKNHPGYGESSYDKINNHQIYHESDLLTFSLVGNQNCGKTTLFNQLTGSNQHVGNFPGVTVDRKDGVIKGYKNTLITDLPGIYSMSPYSSEEIVTRNFLLKEKPKAIINIVDATNIERNLYLTMQLLELNMPMVVALNMMDEMSGNGGTVLINELEAHLGVPVVPISAAKGEGIDELVSHVLHVAYYQEKPQFLQHFDNQALDRCINAIEHLIEDHAKNARIPLRFAASKLAENDSLLLEQLDLSQNEKEILEHIRKQLEEESSFDCSAAIASDRFHSIINICRQTVKKPHESKERLRSQKIDQFLTGKYTGIPAFIGIMGIVFFLTFNVIGSFLQGILENGVSIITNYVDTLLTQAQINVALHSLIIDGIFNGVGTVLSFLPIIVTLFFFLSILEDSGYMARVAFIMDKLLRKIGLSGRSIVPMLIGFGCTVPGVMASRTLSSRRDRQMTIILTPFMSCSAKLPIYAFFTSVFFPGKGALVMIFLYVFGILTGIIFALILKGSLFKGEPVPFVMELPNYRMPGAKNVCQLLWEKA